MCIRTRVPTCPNHVCPLPPLPHHTPCPSLPIIMDVPIIVSLFFFGFCSVNATTSWTIHYKYTYTHRPRSQARLTPSSVSVYDPLCFCVTLLLPHSCVCVCCLCLSASGYVWCGSVSLAHGTVVAFVRHNSSLGDLCSFRQSLPFPCTHTHTHTT